MPKPKRAEVEVLSVSSVCDLCSLCACACVSAACLIMMNHTCKHGLLAHVDSMARQAIWLPQERGYENTRGYVLRLCRRGMTEAYGIAQQREKKTGVGHSVALTVSSANATCSFKCVRLFGKGVGCLDCRHSPHIHGGHVGAGACMFARSFT